MNNRLKLNLIQSIIFGYVFIFLNLGFISAQELELNTTVPLNLNPLDAVNKAGIKNLDTGQVLDRFQFNLPFNWNNININRTTPSNTTNQSIPDIDLKKFLTPKDVSSNDLGDAAKAIFTLVIETFLVVISIVTQILTVILGFLR